MSSPRIGVQRCTPAGSARRGVNGQLPERGLSSLTVVRMDSGFGRPRGCRMAGRTRQRCSWRPQSSCYVHKLWARRLWQPPLVVVQLRVPAVQYGPLHQQCWTAWVHSANSKLMSCRLGWSHTVTKPI